AARPRGRGGGRLARGGADARGSRRRVIAEQAIIRSMDPTLPETRVAAYPGPEGAHSATAAERLFGYARLVSLPSFAAVAEAVATRSVDAGVLPIENTLTG